MKIKFVLNLLKIIITWVVENYNPYANMALAIYSLQQTVRILFILPRLIIHKLIEASHTFWS